MKVENLEKIKAYMFSAMNLENVLEDIEEVHDLDLNRQLFSFQPDHIQLLHSQVPSKYIAESKVMSEHYQTFYCLENYVREMIAERLKEVKGADWWIRCVPEQISERAKKIREKEANLALSGRSSRKFDREIDYVTFGDLGEIIKKNWEIFGDTFESAEAMERVMGLLNSLRSTVAHSSLLPEMEIDRLNLAIKDWLRLMS